MARITTDIAIHRGRRLALVPTILLLANCSSPEQKIELAIRSVRSWEATVRETSAALLTRLPAYPLTRLPASCFRLTARMPSPAYHRRHPLPSRRYPDRGIVPTHP
jgi:hypothetical protein